MISWEKIKNVGKRILAALAKFWQKLVGWIKMVGERIIEKLHKVPAGVATAIKKIGDELQNVSKNYVKNDVTKEWEELTVTQPVPVNEVPDRLRAKAMALASGSEMDTTGALEMELRG